MDKKISLLITKYLKQTISEQEYNQLQEWVMESDYNRADFKDALVKYKRSILYKYSISDTNKRQQRRIFFINSAAAAMVVGLMATTLFLFKTETASVVDSHKEDIIVLNAEKKGVVVTTSGKELELGEIIVGKLLDGVKATNNTLDYSTVQDEPTAIAQQTSIYVPKGEQFQVTLSDGTKLWINSDTKVEYPSVFVDSCRRIKVSGEVFLNVAHNKEKPFIVDVLGAEITVLGTKFNVMAYPQKDIIETTLLDGSVSFHQNDINTILAPNEQLTINRISCEYSISDVEAERYAEWMDGAYHFNEITLIELAELFNRAYGVEVIINNITSMQKRFTGTILTSIKYNEMFQLIMKTTDIRYELDEGHIEIW